MMKNKPHNFRLDELIQAIQSKAQAPTIGCQLARKTAAELSPSGLLRVKRRGGQLMAELVDGWLLADKVHSFVGFVCRESEWGHVWMWYMLGSTKCLESPWLLDFSPEAYAYTSRSTTSVSKCVLHLFACVAPARDAGGAY